MKQNYGYKLILKTTTTSARMAAMEIIPPFEPKDISPLIDFIFKKDEIPNVLRIISDYCGEVDKTNLRNIIPYYSGRVVPDGRQWISLSNPQSSTGIFQLDIELFRGNNIIDDWRLDKKICSEKYVVYDNYSEDCIEIDLNKTKYEIELNLIHFNRTNYEKLKFHIKFLDEISGRIIVDIEFETKNRKCDSEDKFNFQDVYLNYSDNKIVFHFYEQIIKRYV